MTHLDLFSGIGGFSYAVDQVYGKTKHTFIENDPFCQAVLKKHWPEAEIHGDIRQFIADTKRERNGGKVGNSNGEERKIPQGTTRLEKPISDEARNGYTRPINILTGGFPCQPFSQAGRRKGTDDDRYLWPAMFECIQLFRPEWVIAENVRGLVTWNEGMVFETVCADLENEGYEVQPLIVPAVAKGAPHRRDRVWIVANRTGGRQRSGEQERDSQREPKTQTGDYDSDAPDTERKGLERPESNQELQSERRIRRSEPDWKRDWREVALATCHDGVDDGLPRWMDGTTISAARHRKERLKACGNAIVPAIAVEILRAIKEAN